MILVYVVVKWKGDQRQCIAFVIDERSYLFLFACLLHTQRNPHGLLSEVCPALLVVDRLTECIRRGFGSLGNRYGCDSGHCTGLK